MASALKKGNKISQIVRLKQVMQRWRRRCINTHSFTSDSDSEIDRQRRRIPSPGSLAVYVGIERRRFVIPTKFLNLPVFRSLLNKAEEEFGFQKTGGLVLPCDVIFFKRLLKALERNEGGFGSLDLDDFTAMFADLTVDSVSYCKDANNSNCHSFSPLLQKTRV
ncbi:auxin-responsive protein SAUR50-like [Cynara cardunculus var. scolymus]|uniref:Auxin responsive SAUR protein n=1 Tax=Cynara cardunculus var. scolymus TaxID=59895 RepID=A0A103YMP6_CYNCS|nr:auxin-responsive protein SAUR50-like [Cynara cardunculus var. scolymus]KVI11873.1 Auxin responsive SAUR protein [Cynara cardunculus var. scolymus]